MIVITPNRFRFLKTGQPTNITITNPSRYRKGRDYALGLNHRNALCRVDILEVGDSWIRIRLANQDPPRLLAAKSQFGYVTIDPNNPDLDPNLARAMFAEPEPVNTETVERYATEAGERRNSETNWQRLRSVAIQAKDIARRQDAEAFEELRAHLLEVATMRGTAGTAIAA